MSNVVEFLETMGRRAAHLSDAEYIQAVMEADFDEPSRAALLQRDTKRLLHLLDANSPMYCFSFVATPDGDEKSPQDDDHTDEGEENPNEEPVLK